MIIQFQTCIVMGLTVLGIRIILNNTYYLIPLTGLFSYLQMIRSRVLSIRVVSLVPRVRRVLLIIHFILFYAVERGLFFVYVFTNAAGIQKRNVRNTSCLLPNFSKMWE